MTVLFPISRLSDFILIDNSNFVLCTDGARMFISVKEKIKLALVENRKISTNLK